MLDYILKANAENETILLERLESLRAEEKEIEELMDVRIPFISISSII